jgi:HPt (histidine-containing phosphotransfer) domain-containing protein
MQQSALINPAISALWQRNRPLFQERLALLDRAAAGPLTPALRGEAIAIAHKLAGSLGMFGFHDGTRIARELEAHLESPAPDTATLTTLTAELRGVLAH